MELSNLPERRNPPHPSTGARVMIIKGNTQSLEFKIIALNSITNIKVVALHNNNNFVSIILKHQEDLKNLHKRERISNLIYSYISNRFGNLLHGSKHGNENPPVSGWSIRPQTTII